VVLWLAFFAEIVVGHMVFVVEEANAYGVLPDIALSAPNPDFFVPHRDVKFV
jgi:hypothetical protein